MRKSFSEALSECVLLNRSTTPGATPSGATPSGAIPPGATRPGAIDKALVRKKEYGIKIKIKKSHIVEVPT